MKCPLYNYYRKAPLKNLTLSWLSITPFGTPVVPGYVWEEREGERRGEFKEEEGESEGRYGGEVESEGRYRGEVESEGRQ